MEKVPLRARSTLRFMKVFHFVVHAFLYALIEDVFSVHVETALGQHLGSLKLNGSRDENYLRRFLDQHLKSKGDCKHFKFRVVQLSLRSMGNHNPGYVKLLENVKQVRNRLFSLIKGNFCISEADETSMNYHMESFLEDALEKLNDDSLIRKVDSVNCTDYNLLFDELENWIQEDESYGDKSQERNCSFNEQHDGISNY
ncbi:hypothetical protein MAR_032929 [Mya arenaria]|uniref:Uncharacterized protein n=1 Tax=Mya arenaria TaxID=6604 RepID=A0ABY7GAN4_MYAAR|nr:hypothetical protein MAR_032929 [Mya arenaria]